MNMYDLSEFPTHLPVADEEEQERVFGGAAIPFLTGVAAGAVFDDFFGPRPPFYNPFGYGFYNPRPYYYGYPRPRPFFHGHRPRPGFGYYR
jgi:hypothetical protein